jgi:hypothetical protein
MCEALMFYIHDIQKLVKIVTQNTSLTILHYISPVCNKVQVT